MTVVADLQKNSRYGKVNYRDRFQQEKDEFLLYGLAGHEGPAGRGGGEQPEWLHGDDRAAALPAERPQVRRPPVLRGEHRRVQPRDRGMPDLARILRLAGEPAPDQAEQRDAPRQEKVCTELSTEIDKEYRYVSRRHAGNS